MVWNAEYTDWKDFGGVKFPTHIVQHQGMPAFFELNVADVKVNAPVDLTRCRTRSRRWRPRRAAVEAVKFLRPNFGRSRRRFLAGHRRLWRGRGRFQGLHRCDRRPVRTTCAPTRSSPKRSAWSQQADQVRDQHPCAFRPQRRAARVRCRGRHHHYVKGNKAYYEKIFKVPHTLVPDKLSQMTPQPKLKIETMTEKKVLTDGEHTIDLYHVEGSTHANGMIMVICRSRRS